MQDHDPNHPNTLALGSPGAFVTQLPGHVILYQITEQDLEFFASGMRSIFTGLSSSCIAVCISVSLLFALNQSTITPQLGTIMLALAIAAGSVGLIFAAFAVREWRAYKSKLDDFKKTANRQIATPTGKGPSPPSASGVRASSSLRMRRPNSP